MQGAAAQEEILGFLKDLGKNVSKRQQQQGLGGKQLGWPTASKLTLWWPLVQLSTGCKQKCKEKCSSCPKLQVHSEDLVELALWPTMPSLQNHPHPTPEPKQTADLRDILSTKAPIFMWGSSSLFSFVCYPTHNNLILECQFLFFLCHENHLCFMWALGKSQSWWWWCTLCSWQSVPSLLSSLMRTTEVADSAWLMQASSDSHSWKTPAADRRIIPASKTSNEKASRVCPLFCASLSSWSSPR